MNTEQQGEIQTETPPVDMVENHNEQDERAFINSLDDDFDPELSQTEAKEQALETDAAAGIVCVGLMTIEQTMKTMLHPRFKFDPEQCEAVATKVAPLIVKYGANPPPWLAKYIDEIMAVFAIGMLGLSSFMQVKQLKAEDIAQQAKERETTNRDNAEVAA
ncbi:hypothetical protein ABT56_22800 [Photobacterium aquae]|uniref:Uncharacterized protein n=1 Tax=Photobacterium aquae TaxID=1195763 RepID=A0A0J1GJL7_9GAMM|nr:hypothetical protein [Photobacterium aquae]KLU99765.1 hypothetical protein ABT56_22800 [Photobacterium aquae]